MTVDAQTLNRIGELERKVRALYRHLDLDEAALANPGLSPEVQNALAAGNIIGAIQIQRQQTGMSLAEAKAAIEGVEGPRIIE